MISSNDGQGLPLVKLSKLRIHCAVESLELNGSVLYHQPWTHTHIHTSTQGIVTFYPNLISTVVITVYPPSMSLFPKKKKRTGTNQRRQSFVSSGFRVLFVCASAINSIPTLPDETPPGQKVMSVRRLFTPSDTSTAHPVGDGFFFRRFQRAQKRNKNYPPKNRFLE